ncbi:MAG: oxidoreductase [Glaciimonas sp.]|nr:oxidoreductase [Glaciimonas sp.]
METPRIQIAPNGPEFSRVVLGLWRLSEWQLTPNERLTLLEQYLALGITSIDHADIYGDYDCENLFGEALSMAPCLRERIEIISKCGIKLVSAKHPGYQLKHYDTSRAHIIASVERSLSNLRTDYLDLLLIHRPDPLLEADEVAEAFRLLQQAGKVRHFGVSNFTPAQFDLLASRFPLVTNQLELSTIHHDALQDGTLDQCQRLSIAPMIWSALAGGRLFSEHSPRAQRVRVALAAIAAELGVSEAAIAYAWILRHPARPLILTGSHRIDAMREAVTATRIGLSRAQWFAIWSAATGSEVL